MTLDLQSTRIQLFHLGICVNLRSLNLSNNFLTRISTGGLTRCRHLATLDVGDNHIQDQRELEYLQFLPSLQVRRVGPSIRYCSSLKVFTSLQDVVLQGNPVTKTEKYRLVTILYTLQLRGTPTSSGLQVSGKRDGLKRACDIECTTSLSLILGTGRQGGGPSRAFCSASSSWWC